MASLLFGKFYIDFSIFMLDDFCMQSTPKDECGKIFLKFSTIPSEAAWWRVEVTDEDLSWIRKNLGRDLEGKKGFKVLARGVGLPAGFPEHPLPVAFYENERAPRVMIPLGERYDFRRAYLESHESRDPYVSPHGFFRYLEPGYHVHAFQFMQEFGPLFIESDTRLRGTTWWLSLSDFWDRHARYVAVAKLWEDRFQPEKLRDHWTYIGANHELLDTAGAAPLGCIPDLKYKYFRICPSMPWEWEPYRWKLPGLDSHLRSLVYDLLHSELILHTQDCVQTWTRKTVPHDEFIWDEEFAPTRAFTSLWGVIWELFGLDAEHTYSWKLCQVCGRLFYPKDRRSVCCNTQHQSLWSKRQWARRHRTREAKEPRMTAKIRRPAQIQKATSIRKKPKA
jgi:hypothetical protein